MVTDQGVVGEGNGVATDQRGLCASHLRTTSLQEGLEQYE